jgi:hypothetical protein
MRTTKNTVKIEKKEVTTEVKEANFLDRHTSSWFIDSSNNLKVGKAISDFFNELTENFQVKKLHSGDEKYWKLAETADGKFILLARTKLLK